MLPQLDSAGFPELIAIGVAGDSELGRWLALRGVRLVDGAATLLGQEGCLEQELPRCVLIRGDEVAALSQLLLLKDDPLWFDVSMMVVLTAGSEEQRSACLRAGAELCCVEPILLDLLDDLLEGLTHAPASRRASASHRNREALSQVRELVLSVRGVAQAKAAVELIAELCPQPARQALGLSELLMNAVEHGSLEIDAQDKANLLAEGTFQHELRRRVRDPRFAEREVTVRVRRFHDHVEITCEDQGPGFDWRAAAKRDLDGITGLSGRGIALAKAVAFDSVEFHGRGNIVVARAYANRQLVLPRKTHASAELSPWERQALEHEVDAVLDGASDDDLFTRAVGFVLRHTESRLGCVLYVNEHGALVAPEPTACMLGCATRNATSLERAALAPHWADLFDSLQTQLVNGPHRLYPDAEEVRCSLSTPVLHRGQAIGLLHVSDGAADYTLRDARRLEVVAQKLAPWLAARLIADIAERRSADLLREQERIQDEHQLARHLVGSMLREGCLDGAGIRHLLNSRDLFNGDLALAARLPNGGLRWMLGDFVGHGLSAAIGGLPLASVFYATTRKGVPLAEVVATMNDNLLSVLPPGLFCAAILVELTPDGSQVLGWNGGMPPGLLLSANSGEVRELVSEDLPLGAVPSANLAIPISAFRVSHGDRVLCFSDGLPETRNASGELYGIDRARLALSAAAPELAFDELLRSVKAFRDYSPRNDDVSLIEVTVGAI